jgi:hypothetical protein
MLVADFPPEQPRFDALSGRVEFVVDNVELERLFS